MGLGAGAPSRRRVSPLAPDRLFMSPLPRHNMSNDVTFILPMTQIKLAHLHTVKYPVFTLCHTQSAGDITRGGRWKDPRLQPPPPSLFFLQHH